MEINQTGTTVLFLSTPSARRATHRFKDGLYLITFLSTPSARRATYEYRIFHTKLVFLSTPSARRATVASAIKELGIKISIHALREEGDPTGAGVQAITE